MVDLSKITLTDGIPTSGDGDVATINALMADGGLATVGNKADAAAVATDATPVTGISLWKQISKSLQAIAAQLPAALADTGGLKVDGSGAALPVSLGSVPSHAVTNNGNFLVKSNSGHTLSATMTPGAAAISAGDVVGGVLTFTGMTGPAEVQIDGVTLMINRASIIASEGAYRLHFYNATPPSAYADNAAWDLPAGDRASYIGFVDIAMPSDMGSTMFTDAASVYKRAQLVGANLYGYLVTVAGFTETADVHTIKMHVREV